MNNITYTPIGYAETPHKAPEQIPIQPVYCEGIKGRIVINEDLTEGLMDLAGFNYIHLVFHFHKAKEAKLYVKPYLDDNLRGIFATRAPHRPNPIGLSIVKLLSIEDNILKVSDIDLLDGTPILDIKPYIRDFELRQDATLGWRKNISEENVRSRAKRAYDSRTIC